MWKETLLPTTPLESHLTTASSHQNFCYRELQRPFFRLPKWSLNNPPKNHNFPLIMKVSFTNYENILVYFQNTTLHYKLLFNLLYKNSSANITTDISSWYSQHAQPLPCFTLYQFCWRSLSLQHKMTMTSATLELKQKRLH